METNLEVMYSNVTNLAKEAFTLKRRIDKIRSRTALRRLLTGIITRDVTYDAVLRRDKEQILRFSKPEEQAHPLFDSLIPPNFMENLARLTVERFSLDPTRVQILLDFHRRNRELITDLIPTKPLATIILVGGVAATTIPKEAFEAINLQGAYGAFQLVISILVLAPLIYFAGQVGVFRWSLRPMLAEHRFCEQLLEVAELISRYDDRTLHQSRQHMSAESSEERNSSQD
jgi:hypothetical protein